MITLEEAIAKGRGTERAFSCHAHANRSITASVNVMKGVWYCYSCAAHGEIEDHVPTVEDALSILSGEKRARTYAEEWLDAFDMDYSSPYWVSRVGIEVAYANRCGTDILTGTPTYPIRDEDGAVVGLVTRHDTEGPKYKYPYGVSTSRALYGPMKRCDVLVLCEGAGDVMALQQAGLPEGWNAVGCYGAGIHYPQVSLVANMAPRVVVAAFDDDLAGQAANERAYVSIDDLAPVLSHRWSTFGGKDPGEIPLAERIPALTSTVTAAGYRP